uniref:Serpentine receptor class gamma n=1 Tax=Panagrellus redivivus TaxID=6233 RepID=A0A7E4VX22_PANRE
MKSFKNLLIAGMPFQIYSTALIIFTIPIYVFNFGEFKLHGLIHDTPREVTVGIMTIANVCDQINSDLLLVMLVNRYHILTSDFIDHSQYLYPGIYGFVVVTNVIQNGLLVTKLILRKMIPFLENSFITNEKFFVIATGVILLTRTYAHIKIFLLNRSFAATMHSMVTPGMLQLHTKKCVLTENPAADLGPRGKGRHREFTLSNVLSQKVWYTRVVSRTGVLRSETSGFWRYGF